MCYSLCSFHNLAQYLINSSLIGILGTVTVTVTVTSVGVSVGVGVFAFLVCWKEN